MQRNLSILLMLILALISLVALPATAATNTSSQCTKQAWVGTWMASPIQTVAGFADLTYRTTFNTHISGDMVRVRLSNVFGQQPLTIDDVYVGRQLELAAVVPGTNKPVTFNGNRNVTIPAGAELWSDPVALSVPALSRVSVSIYAAAATGRVTAHSSLYGESDVGYLSVSGNHASEEDGSSFIKPSTDWMIVNGLDVLTDGPAGTVVALGDSITDGFFSTQNQDKAWPDFLARRLINAGIPISVLNAGITGNMLVLNDPKNRGPRGLDRLERDVFSQTGVTDLIVLEGINDLAAGAAVEQLIMGYRQVIELAHKHGIRVHGGLLTPSGDETRPSVFRTHSTPEVQEKRHQINEWIKNSGEFDSVLDFESAVADPLFPEWWKPGTSYDNLHGNDLGYQLMAEAVPLTSFAGPRCLNISR
ncbi:GDSL-type esterase/lipase family protein [Paenibacillus tarimensis]